MEGGIASKFNKAVHGKAEPYRTEGGKPLSLTKSAL